MRLGIHIATAMKSLITIFAEKSKDRTTLDELFQMIDDRSQWPAAHGLFRRIRIKTIEAAKQGDPQLESQFCFEEACAKTLYNVSGEPAPFDADSPYWIIPNALVAARHFGIDRNEIISAIISN